MAQLYERYQPRGFEILAFPCNQFGGQEPGSSAEIKAKALRLGARYKLFSKIEVNGPGENELYTFLKDAQRGGPLSVIFGRGVKWNFEKFLVDRSGRPVARYGPRRSPLSFEQDIQALL